MAKKTIRKAGPRNIKVHAVKHSTAISSNKKTEQIKRDDEGVEIMVEDDDDLAELDDAKSIISISSEASEDSELKPTDRPWLKFSDAARRHWESMYANVTATPIAGSWEITEDYQREKDMEMLRYLEDFPLQNWIISKKQSEQAYSHLLERTRWRSLEIRIYGREPVPGWTPGLVASEQLPQTHHRPTGPNHGGPGPMHNVPHFEQHQMVPQPSTSVMPLERQMKPKLVQSSSNLPGSVPSKPSQTASSSTSSSSATAAAAEGQNVASLLKIKPRRGKEKKDSSTAFSPSAPPLTPPYPEFKNQHEGTVAHRTGRKSTRKQGDAEDFPWTRQINFREAKAKATWDDSVYDQETSARMAATRARNMPIIAEIDAKIIEQQRESMRLARAAKKQASINQPENPDLDSYRAKGGRKGGRKKSDANPKAEGGHTPTEPYHSGQYSFATAKDQDKATSLGTDTPDALIDATEAKELDLAISGPIRICWNPGKRASGDNLEQAVFSVRDTVLTRQQLAKTPILTQRAAECIIDFCPDMLWRSMLLRIASEAGYGNKDVRDRFCWNGCYCDKATITKRISAALGQKQTQAKSKGYGLGELEWYDHNVKTFSQYIDFFGKRTGHRNWVRYLEGAEKRRRGEDGEDEGDGEGDGDGDGQGSLGQGQGKNSLVKVPQEEKLSDKAQPMVRSKRRLKLETSHERKVDR